MKQRQYILTMLSQRTPLLIIPCLATCFLVFLLLGRVSQDVRVNSRCEAILLRGQWSQTWPRPASSQIWTPPGCLIHSYTSSDVRSCLSKRQLTFLGDSTARQLFWATSQKLDYARALNASQSTPKHEDVTFQTDELMINFIWDPFLNTTGSIDDVVPSPSIGNLDFTHTRHTVVIGAGLWHTKHLKDSSVTFFREVVGRKIGDNGQTRRPSEILTNRDELQHERHQPQLLFLPVVIPGSLEASKDIGTQLNSVLLETVFPQGSGVLESYSQMVMRSASPFKDDRIHVTDHIASTQSELILNYICNDITEVPSRQSQSYCCVPYIRPHLLQKMFLFTLSCVAVFYLFWSLSRRKHCFQPEEHSLVPPKVPSMAGSMATIAVAALYSFLADRTVVFKKAPKTINEEMFVGLSIFSLLAGVITFGRTRAPPAATKESVIRIPEHRQILSRQQTEEWKGWMQIVILLYHYFGMSKNLWVYQCVRLLVSAYLFMTGFGHTTYFITTNDFSLQRAAAVLLRTNLLSIILSFVMGTNYDLYYFPVLSSVWFFIAWITISKTPSSGINVRQLLCRIAVSGMAVRFILGAVSYFETTSIVDGIPSLGMIKINWHEFLFRFGLDAYIVYVGMLAAVFCARYTASLDIRHQRGSGAFIPWSTLTSKLAVPLAGSIVLTYAVFCWAFPDKYRYNKWHPFVSPFPVLAFVVLRNSTSGLSSSHSRLFAWVGRCSLETFVLQYHILLGADSRGLLQLGLADTLSPTPGIGKYLCDTVEFILIVSTFLWMSSGLSKALPVITSSLVCQNGKPKCSTQEKMESGTLVETETMAPAGPFRQRVELRTRLILILVFLWALNLLWTRLE